MITLLICLAIDLSVVSFVLKRNKKITEELKMLR